MSGNGASRDGRLRSPAKRSLLFFQAGLFFAQEQELTCSRASKQQTLFLYSLFITHTSSVLEAADPAISTLKILSPRAYVLPRVMKMRGEPPVQEEEADGIFFAAHISV